MTGRALQCFFLCLTIFFLLGAGDEGARFEQLGHQLMCICGCHQVLLECNHVGCPDSDGMRNELMAAVTRNGGGGDSGTGGGGSANAASGQGDSDSLILQSFVQKYGPTVLAAPTNTGFNRTAWIVPFVALALGLMTVVFVVRSWRNRPAPALAPGLRSARRVDLAAFRDQARKETEL